VKLLCNGGGLVYSAVERLELQERGRLVQACPNLSEFEAANEIRWALLFGAVPAEDDCVVSDIVPKLANFSTLPQALRASFRSFLASSRDSSSLRITAIRRANGISSVNSLSTRSSDRRSIHRNVVNSTPPKFTMNSPIAVTHGRVCFGLSSKPAKGMVVTCEPLTIDMSGGGKHGKHAGGRPRDGRVGDWFFEAYGYSNGLMSSFTP